MQISQEHFKTIVYVKFEGERGGGTNRVYYGELENREKLVVTEHLHSSDTAVTYGNFLEYY